jgi:hypothetical protein
MTFYGYPIEKPQQRNLAHQLVVTVKHAVQQAIKGRRVVPIGEPMSVDLVDIEGTGLAFNPQFGHGSEMRGLAVEALDHFCAPPDEDLPRPASIHPAGEHMVASAAICFCAIAGTVQPPGVLASLACGGDFVT